MVLTVQGPSATLAACTTQNLRENDSLKQGRYAPRRGTKRTKGKGKKKLCCTWFDEDTLPFGKFVNSSHWLAPWSNEFAARMDVCKEFRLVYIIGISGVSWEHCGLFLSTASQALLYYRGPADRSSHGPKVVLFQRQSLVNFSLDQMKRSLCDRTGRDSGFFFPFIHSNVYRLVPETLSYCAY